MANHLEQLIGEWLEFKGYIVRFNVKVGRREGKGGYEGELDVVAYSPEFNKLIHVEASHDADSWSYREYSFEKKLACGRKHIRKIFPWIPKGAKLEQWVVLWASDINHKTIGGGKVIPIWQLYKNIAEDLNWKESPYGNAIPEQYPLLRTMRMALFWVPERI